MEYLKPIISKITEDIDIIEDVKKMNSDRDVLAFLINKGFSKNGITKILERYYGVNYVDLDDYDINIDLLNQFDTDFLEKQSIFPYKEDKVNKTYYFALSDIVNQEATKSIAHACNSMGLKAIFNFSFEHEIIEKYEKLHSDKLFSSHTDFNAQDWVDELLDEGIRIGASDIHIERLESSFQTRYRVDGLLTNKKTFYYSEAILSSIYVRLKIISGMDISEKRKPQDGRIDNYIYNDKKYDMRVSSVNTIYGEKIVIRIFEKTSNIQSFAELGFDEKNEKKVKRMLKNKNGIIYLGGATGSGKTTSLYSMIDELNHDDVNIYTIENPVEKTIENVNQIQINQLAGIDYVSTLKALLRQDPDIIVVGEIRDSETANLSNRASLTGHLVLSTIHANNALDSISRLMDMEIEPYILSAGTIGFISQRLVRVLCPYCKEKTDKLLPHERAWVDKTTKEYRLKEHKDDEFYKAVGCPHCSNGYKGRVAVIEILEVNETIRGLLSQEVDLSIIREAALKNNEFSPLAIDGLKKALKGVTTVDELVRQLN